MFDLSVNTDTGESARIIGGKFLARFLNGEQVCNWVDCDDRGISSSPNSDGFAAPCVANYVADRIVACPRSFCSRHVLTLNQDTESMILGGEGPSGLQLLAHRDVQLAARGIIR